jgi:hypothetical protein
MRFAADYSEILEVFLPPTDGISGHLYVSQSVVCETASVQEDGTAETVECLGLHVHQT